MAFPIGEVWWLFQVLALVVLLVFLLVQVIAVTRAEPYEQSGAQLSAAALLTTRKV